MNQHAAPPAGTNRPPLVTADQLKVDFAHVEAAIAELEATAAQAPPVLEDDDDLTTINALVPKLRGFAKRCNDLREEQKRPHLEAGRVVDTFFKSFDTRLAGLQKQLEQRATLYLRKKAEAEAARRKEEETRLRDEALKREQEAAEARNSGNVEQAATFHAAAADAMNRADDAAAPAKAADLARTHTAAGTATLQETWTFEITNIDAVDLNALRPYLTRPDIEKAIRAYVRAGRRELAGVRIYSEANARMR